MKKILIALSAMTSIATPIAITVSCGNGKNKSAGLDNSKAPQTTTPQTTTPQTTIVSSAQTPQQLAFTNFKIDKDGIYFWQKTYLNGKLWNNETIADGKPLDDQQSNKLVPMQATNDTFSHEQVVELGDNDKFYVAFNNDDNDGLTPQDFEKEFFFEDSSYSSAPDIDSLNTQLGNVVVKTSMWSELKVGFKDGYSNAYLGSQSNHVQGTWEEAMARLKTDVAKQQGIYEAVENYYKSASHAFFPEAINQGMFTYKKVTDRIYEVTYHYDQKPVTQGFFVLANQKDPSSQKFPALSLGDQGEWAAYHNDANSKYFAVKDIYINKP